MQETKFGYWVVMDSAISTERLAMAGYDYVCVDAQHGILDHAGVIRAIQAIDAGGGAQPWVRVAENTLFAIGRVLDAGARGVIVPLVNNAREAAQAVAYTKYPPQGVRSYGPMRSSLRFGPEPAVVNELTQVFVMIETQEGFDNLDEILAVPGLTGVYIGPSDLAIALGGATPTDPAVQGKLAEAIEQILQAAHRQNKLAGVHTLNGEVAKERLAQGFDVITIASDVVHLEQAARAHLAQAKG